MILGFEGSDHVLSTIEINIVGPPDSDLRARKFPMIGAQLAPRWQNLISTPTNLVNIIQSFQ